MKLDSNNYGINLIFELTVTSDLDVDPEDIVYSIAKQLQLKKENEKLKKDLEGLYNKDVLKMKNRKDIIVANV